MNAYADAVVLLYHRRPQRWYPDATTVVEHVRAFNRYSRFDVHALNVDCGFPSGLEGIEPGAIVLHYSLFGSMPYYLTKRFLSWLDRSRAYKICFFQDEYFYCRQRFQFLDEHEVDCVFTLVGPERWSEVYGRYAHVSRLEYNLPGYVSDELLAASARHARPVATRVIDVGYRARPLPAHWGRGAREKTEIGERFAELAADTGLTLDIDTSEAGRLYGAAWYEFVASCRFMLGVESGVSVFDLEDEVREQYQQLCAQGITPTLAELERGALGRWDGRVPHRTISPRHFEAAALSTGQILFEGHYAGVLEPGVHYIAVRKDFSNFDEVVESIRDPAVRERLVDTAYRDLIGSGAWSYSRLLRQFDDVLADAGLIPYPAPALAARLARGSASRATRRALRWYPQWLLWVRWAEIWERLTPLTGLIRRLMRRPRPIPFT